MRFERLCNIRRSDCGSKVIDVGAAAVLSRREVDWCVLTADFDENLGLITCEEALFSHSAKQWTAVDRRRYNLFQSAVKAVSKVVWIETEGRDQEEQACYDGTCDDKMT